MFVMRFWVDKRYNAYQKTAWEQNKWNVRWNDMCEVKNTAQPKKKRLCIIIMIGIKDERLYMRPEYLETSTRSWDINT